MRSILSNSENVRNVQPAEISQSRQSAPDLHLFTDFNLDGLNISRLLLFISGVRSILKQSVVDMNAMHQEYYHEV